MFLGCRHWLEDLQVSSIPCLSQMLAICETIVLGVPDIFDFAFLIGDMIFNSSKMKKTSRSLAWDFHVQVS